MTVRFYLKGVKEEKGIFMMLRRYGIQVYTKQKVHPKDWDDKRQRAKKDWILNDLLDKMAKIMMDVVRTKIKNNEVPTKEDVLVELDRQTALFEYMGEKGMTVAEYAERFMNLHRWGDGYRRHFKSWIHLFDDRYPGMLISKLDYIFYREYSKYLLDTYKKNTANAQWRKFKRVLDDMVIGKMEIDETYKKIKIGTEVVYKVYVTKEEMVRWYDAMAGMPEYMRNASGLFLIGCNTGLRYGDFKNVRSTVTVKDGVKYYRVMTGKTNTLVTIPDNEMLNKLLAMDMHEISNQKMNAYVKEAAAWVGLNEVCHVDGKDVPKHELIETHTARRSFATNAVLDGIPISFIMSITGHKTEADFRKYVRVDDMMNAVKFAGYRKGE